MAAPTQVRKANIALVMVCHKAVCLMVLVNLKSGRIPYKLGIWSRRAEDLSRYGNGGLEDREYATTLLWLVSVYVSIMKHVIYLG